MNLNPDNEFCFCLFLLPDFRTIHIRCWGSSHILIHGHFEHEHLLNISCSKHFDICKIKCMVTSLMLLGYVNNYDKNRYPEKFPKAAVYHIQLILCIIFEFLYV